MYNIFMKVLKIFLLSLLWGYVTLVILGFINFGLFYEISIDNPEILKITENVQVALSIIAAIVYFVWKIRFDIEDKTKI